MVENHAGEVVASGSVKGTLAPTGARFAFLAPFSILKKIN
jgi:hypothetical protein